METVLPGYFETLHSRMLEGRTFTESDNASRQKLAVIDHSLAEKVFPNQSALERRICVFIPDPTWLRVIGVVEHQRLHSLADPGREQIFVTDGFWGIGISRHWAIRTEGDPENYAAIVRSEIAKFAPGRLAITDMQTMDTTMSREQAGTRFDLLLYWTVCHDCRVAGRGWTLRGGGECGPATYGGDRPSDSPRC